MRAVLYTGEKDVSVQRVPIPAPGENEVLVRVLAVGICGSDLHAYHGRWGRPKYAPGHELVGEVVQAGAGVLDLLPGQRVCAECFSHCGTCRYCKAGLYNLCQKREFVSSRNHGGMAEYCVLHRSSLFPVPDSLTNEQAVLVEPLAVAWRAWCQANPKPGDTAAVVGAGTIGLLAGACAKAGGAVTTFIFARYEHQARTATAMGLEPAGDCQPEQFAKAVLAATYGFGADVVVETTASADGFALATRVARPAGSVSLVGGYSGAQPIDLGQVVGKELRLIGSNCYGISGTRADFLASMALLETGAVDPNLLITHRYPIGRAHEAFATAADKSTGAIKVLILPQAD
ncbi:MAG: zinc-dependent alcohol dehydrogenase [Armatimonadota bacterium]